MSAIPNAPDDEGPPSPTGASGTVQRHSIQVSRPFDVVKRQIVELDERWLEDAVRTASERSEASPPDMEARGAFLDVRVRVGRPYVGRRVFALPMEWEVRGGTMPPALTGELEVLQAGPAEAELAVRMIPRPEVLPEGDEERRRIQHTVEVATRSFLNRVFWTLEALSRFDPFPARRG